jgi:hypothetical protein
MNAWLIILFNLLIVASWVYLLYLVYNLDPKIQAEWKGAKPSWADEYDSFINSVKVTSFINGGLVLLTILTAVYKQYNAAYMAVAGRRR